jgi:parallel beta-helix repeat protein
MKSMNKTLTFLILALLIATAPSIEYDTVKAQSNTIIVPDDYPTISAAIPNAANGDTILVRVGTYDENAWKIDKTVTIISEVPNGAKLVFHPPTYQSTVQLGRLESSRITSTNFNDSIVVNADNVAISGFVITNAPIKPNDYETGFISIYGKQALIGNNTLGVDKISFNLNMNGFGDEAVNNTVAQIGSAGNNQTVSNNNGGGIGVSGNYSKIADNNAHGLTLYGSNNLITGNSFNLIPVRAAGGGWIKLIAADYNIISNNTVLCGGTTGISLGYGASPDIHGCSHNIFSGNNVEGATLAGILLARGDYNVFYGNRIANCKGESYNGTFYNGIGLALGGSHEKVEQNLFFGNIFEDNLENFCNRWQINGTNFFDNGTVGNYWDDYGTKYPAATEVGNSGTGNIPYLVYSNVMDNHPLMNKPNIPSVIPTLSNAWLSINSGSPDPATGSIDVSGLTIAGIVTLFVIAIVSLLFYGRHRRISRQPTA